MKALFIFPVIVLVFAFSGCKKMMMPEESTTKIVIKNENVSDTKYTVQYSKGSRCSSSSTCLVSEKCLNPGESATCTFSNAGCRKNTYFRVVTTSPDYTKVFEQQIPAYHKTSDNKTITFSCKKNGETLALDFDIPEESKGTALQ